MTNPIIEKLQKALDAEKIRITPIVRSQAAKWKVDLVNLLAKILKVDITPDIRIEQMPHVPTNTTPTTTKPVTKTKAKRKK
jgi:hypothetical protein